MLYETAEGGVALPGDKVVYVFYDFETTQNTKYTDEAKLHVPNLVCVQQFCSRCEDVEALERDCVRFGKRKFSSWPDPVGDLFISMRTTPLGQ